MKEVEWSKGNAENDTLLLDRILIEDFQMIDQEGTCYTKKMNWIGLDWIKVNAIQNDPFSYEIQRYEFIENGTAVICGTGHILKDSVISTYQSNNILVMRDENWNAILSNV